MDSDSISNFHPLLMIFPAMEKPAFAEFVADIKVNGQRASRLVNDHNARLLVWSLTERELLKRFTYSGDAA
jgi:hypothetical protein